MLNASRLQTFESGAIRPIIDEYASSARTLCRDTSLCGKTRLEEAPLNRTVCVRALKRVAIVRLGIEYNSLNRSPLNDPV